MKFHLFIRHLSNYGFDDLPGQEAQLVMAPNIRQEEIRNMGTGNDPVKSGVIILVYPGNGGEAHTVFIRRPQYDGVHSGQIAFPGGRHEEDDNDMMETALREAEEEIGIARQDVQVAGKLTDLYIPPSNYLVSPFIGILPDKPVFYPDNNEVAQIIEVPLRIFVEDNYRTRVPMTMATGECMDTPCYLVDHHTIWGATAMIMAEFVAVIRKML